MVSKFSIYLTVLAGLLGFFLNSAHADVSTIEGSIHFVLHYTIVPLTVMPAETTQQFPPSLPYWTLNVTSDGTDYEVGQRFNLGDDSQPASLDLGGVTIPAGSVISLKGQVSYCVDNYAYLQNVDDVVLIRKDYQVILPTREPIDDAFSEWSCSGVNAAQAEIFAHIWYQTASDELRGSYAMELSTEGFRNSAQPLVQIALFETTEAKQQRGALVFQAENDQAKASLSIQQTSQVVAQGAQVPGVLNFALTDASSDSVRVSCVRNR
jgi:hypothetical protein